MKAWHRWFVVFLVPIFAFQSLLFSFASFDRLAVAQSAPEIAIVGFQPAVEAVERDLLEGLSSYLQGQANVRVVSAESVNSFLTKMELKETSDAQTKLKQAEESFRAGKRAYELLKADVAVREFTAALRAFEKSMAYLESNRYLLMAYLYLGMSKFLRKKTKEGRDAIRAMIVLDPKRASRKLSAKFFPPKIISTYEDIKQEVLANSKATLEVNSTPERARVLLDGVRVGRTPYKATGLSAGKHYVSVYKRGFARWSQAVTLKPGKNSVDAELKRNLAYPPVERRALFISQSTALQQTAKQLGADILLLATLQAAPAKKSAYQIKGQLFSASTGSFSRVEVLQVENSGLAKQRGFRFGKILLDNLNEQGAVVPWTRGSGDRLAKQEPQSGREADLQVPALSDVPGITETDIPELAEWQAIKRSRKKPFYKSTWFWVVVGAVVAGGAGVLVFTDIGKSDADHNILVIDNPSLP